MAVGTIGIAAVILSSYAYVQVSAKHTNLYAACTHMYISKCHLVRTEERKQYRGSAFASYRFAFTSFPNLR